MKRSISILPAFVFLALASVLPLRAESGVDSVPGPGSSAGPVAADPATTAAIDPYMVIGMKPSELLDALGAPLEVFSFRGTLAEEDNVIFYYPDHSYFFFYANRVWQIRADHRFSGSVSGVFPGMTRAEAETKLGPPQHDLGDSVIYRLPYRSFPLKARIVYREGGVYDIYVYRGDF